MAVKCLLDFAAHQAGTLYNRGLHLGDCCGRCLFNRFEVVCPLWLLLFLASLCPLPENRIII